MKNVIIIILMVVLAIANSFAQKISADKVPTPVMSAFKVKFPSAVKVKWSLETPKEYEAEFKLNRINQSANFSEDGKWIETEVDISKSDLPQEVVNSINNHYPGCKICEVEQASNPDINLFYGVTIKLNGKEYDIDIKPTGEIIKAVEVKEKDKD